MFQELVKGQMDIFFNTTGLRIGQDSTKFEYFVSNNLLKKYEFSLNDLSDGIVDGGGDEGIDAIYIVIDEKVIGNDITTYDDLNNIINKKSDVKIIIIQAKRANGFGENAIIGVKRGLECIFENEFSLSNEKFKQKAEIIRNVFKVFNHKGCISDIQIEINYCTLARSKEIAEENERVMREMERLCVYSRSLSLIPEFKFIGCNELLNICREPIEYRKTLKTFKKFEYPKRSSNLVEGYLCLVNIKDYYNFIMNNKGNIEDKIFEENIRDYQGTDAEVNTAIRNTIAGTNSGQFWCLNNGITIIAHNIKPLEDELTMSNYQIVNGCQTSYTLFDTISNMTDEERENLEGELVVKVIELKEDSEGKWNEDLMLQIIESTNSQTKIDDFAFESHKPIHKRIEDYFKMLDAPLYYERKPKYYERRGYPKTSILNPFELFKAFYSIYYKAPSAVRNSPSAYFKENKNKVFNLNNNLEYYGIAYKLYLSVTKRLIELKENNHMEDDKIISFIIRNGVLHITRVVFSLKNKNEFKINELTSNDLSNVIDIELYNEVLSNNLNIEEEIEVALQIVKKCILELKQEDKGSLENILKSPKVDTTIKKNMVMYLKGQPKEKKKSEINGTHLIKRLENVINSFEEGFQNISVNGDMRYNFTSRLNSYIYFLNHYSVSLNLNIKELIAVLTETKKAIQEKNRPARIETAKEVLKTTNIIKQRLNSLKESA